MLKLNTLSTWQKNTTNFHRFASTLVNTNFYTNLPRNLDYWKHLCLKNLFSAADFSRGLERMSMLFTRIEEKLRYNAVAVPPFRSTVPFQPVLFQNPCRAVPWHPSRAVPPFQLMIRAVPKIHAVPFRNIATLLPIMLLLGPYAVLTYRSCFCIRSS